MTKNRIPEHILGYLAGAFVSSNMVCMERTSKHVNLLKAAVIVADFEVV